MSGSSARGREEFAPADRDATQHDAMRENQERTGPSLRSHHDELPSGHRRPVESPGDKSVRLSRTLTAASLTSLFASLSSDDTPATRHKAQRYIGVL